MTTLSQTNSFDDIGQIEIVTVGVSGYYDITADGAQGGAGGGAQGGLGAMASGDVYLTAGARLEIVVGGEGKSPSTTARGAGFGGGGAGGGGGGGGSFVIELNNGQNINEVIAGGGGGGGSFYGGGFYGGTGGGGRTQGTGGNGDFGPPGGAFGAGGINGAPGQGGFSVPAEGGGGGGGGGFSGGAGGRPGQAGGAFGATFAGGFGYSFGGGGGGGFGGGGGGGIFGPGGGGGFGGGGGGYYGGGGGGSFVNANAIGVAKVAATHSGNGLVTIALEGTAPCYCRGTLIATANGDVPVEALVIGDEVVTASSAKRPIKWIGRRSYGGRFFLGRSDVLPICIKAGALGDNAPTRDLWVSPHHAMYFKDGNDGGVLIEAKDSSTASPFCRQSA